MYWPCWLRKRLPCTPPAQAFSSTDRHLVVQGWTWVGIGLALLQLWVWTGILARTELSLAFPISSLCYPLTMVAAQYVFREPLGWSVWAGALLITLGVAIVSSTSAARGAVTPPPPF